MALRPKKPARRNARVKRAAAQPKTKSRAPKKRAPAPKGRGGVDTKRAAKAAKQRSAPRKAAAPAQRAAKPSALVGKNTPVLFVESIERVLPFWAKVGVHPTVQVPGPGGAAGFAILTNGVIEVMYQTWAMLGDDMPELARRAATPDKSFLFLEVSDIDRVATALGGEPIFLPRRDTFYGATEIGYRDPDGHHITFAQFGNTAG
jgi:hypothetical protein